MRLKIAALVLASMMVVPLAAQSGAADSVRLRVTGAPPTAWRYGTFVSLDEQHLAITESAGSVSYAVRDVSRFQVKRRKGFVQFVLVPTLAVAAGVGLAALADDGEPLFGSDAADIAVAAGVGMTISFISVTIRPWRWCDAQLGLRVGPPPN